MTVKRQQAAHLLVARMCSDLKGMQMNGGMHIVARSILNLAETQPLQASLWMCIYSFLQYALLKYFIVFSTFVYNIKLRPTECAWIFSNIQSFVLF